MAVSPVIPTFRYRDPRAAIAFLTEGLGFEAGLVVEGEDGRIEHAQLLHGSGVVMLGEGSDSTADWELGNASVYVVVASDADVDASYERALAAGATSVLPPEEQDYGGRNATVRDAEGNYWSIGSYDPGSH